MAYRHSFLELITNIIVIVSLFLSHGDALSTLSLGRIKNVDPTGVSVSGFSSGGAMSMQFHFVYSQFLKGAGIFAGSPYLCGGNFLLCLVTPGLIDLDLLIARADNNSAQGLIDDVVNIAGKNVFVYHGQLDTSNRPPNGEKITDMYKHYGANIVGNLETQAEHGMPTNFYGAACGESAKETEYITNCNYNAAFEMLNHIYDSVLTAPEIDEEISGELSLFDQNPYFVDGSANNHSMNDSGYAYVPSRCTNETVSCKLHVVFHGCSQYSGMIDDIYVKKTGYLEVAEANDIIVLFPQTIAISEEQVNPGGCWDTWGFAELPEETSQFGTKLGKQVSAVFSMLQDILQDEN